MIPSFNPRPDYLEETLRSILLQDPGRSEMQIEVIDDCSPNGPPIELVNKIAGDRISVHGEAKNLGLAGIWNRCIRRAKGEWIHILHQDDVVLPGFYEKLKAGIASPASPGLMYCRHAFMNERGHWLWLSEIDAEEPGILGDALPHLARTQMIQAPATVVRRSVYESLGGFRSDFNYALDWEMWCRIATKYLVWYDPAILACYRIHASNQTSQLATQGKDIEEIRKCIKTISGYVPERKIAAQVRRFALKRYALRSLEHAERFADNGKFAAALQQIRGALRCSVSVRVLKRTVVLGLIAAKQMIKTAVRGCIRIL